MRGFFKDDAGPRALQSIVRDQMVREIAAVLDDGSVRFMPFKGVILAHWAYADPAERRMSDVDILVAPGTHERALQVLEAAGYVVHERGVWGHEYILTSPGMPLPIDLHVLPFGPGRYRLTTRDLFARAGRDETMFGVPILLPDPYDAFAHVVGHAISESSERYGDCVGRDLAGLLERQSLDPATCARRLDATGLARAARYILNSINRRPTDKILDHLSPDGLARPLIPAATYLLRRFSPTALPARIGRLLLNTSLIQSAGLVCKGLAERDGLGNVSDATRGYQPGATYSPAALNPDSTS